MRILGTKLPKLAEKNSTSLPCLTVFAFTMIKLLSISQSVNQSINQSITCILMIAVSLHN